MPFVRVAASHWLAISLAFAVVATAASAATVVRVPADAATLTAALSQVSDGGVIELASGTYVAPSGGFKIFSATKRYTVRAAPGASVVLSGGGTTDVLRVMNTPGTGRPLVFEGITIANGRSNTAGIGAGVTLANATVTFVDCQFLQNTSVTVTNGGGAISVGLGSTAYFSNVLMSGNTAKLAGGAILAYEGSRVFVHGSQLIDNHTNVAGHQNNAFGGAIAVVDATLRVTQSRFEGNGAGYAGGAIYALGSWTDPVATPAADVLIANSTFVNNVASPAAGVTAPGATEGGAIHGEDQTTLRIFHSRFESNESQGGGALSCYRCITAIEHSIFRANAAVGTGSGQGNGGALFIHSDDVNDSSTNSGATNRRAATLTVDDTLFEGASDGVGNGRLGGCVFVGGDTSRAYGTGVPAQGGLAGNRAPAVLSGVVFADCDVLGDSSQGGYGGAIAASLADLTLSDSLLMQSDARSATSADAAGGALALFSDTTATVARCFFALNTARMSGGAIWVLGASLALDGSYLVENSLTNSHSGAAIFFAPDGGGGPGAPRNVAGTVTDCVLSDNTGPSAFTILDGDYTNGPINAVQYGGNTFYPDTSFDYLHSMAGTKNAAGLNALVVNRSNGTSTVKAPTHDNGGAVSAPKAGAIWAIPTQQLPAGAAGDSDGAAESDLAYAWTGATQATVDGQARTGYTGLDSRPSVGQHALVVSGQTVRDTVTAGALPATTLVATPYVVAPGGTSSLAWSTDSGTFLEEAIDQGVALANPAASGSTALHPTAGTVYRGFLIAEEGGAVGQGFVAVRTGTAIFDGDFESGGVAAWSSTQGG
ncbi:MAG: hypothetical protein U0610_03485 [bacterium]